MKKLTLKRVPLFSILSQNCFYRFCRSDWNRRFFNNNFEADRFRGDPSRTCLHILQIGGVTFANAIGFGWGVDRNENQIGAFDVSVDIRGEK